MLRILAGGESTTLTRYQSSTCGAQNSGLDRKGNEGIISALEAFLI